MNGRGRCLKNGGPSLARDFGRGLDSRTSLVHLGIYSENNSYVKFSEDSLHKLIVRFSILAFGFATMLIIASVYTH